MTPDARATSITVFGRMPVLEALADDERRGALVSCIARTLPGARQADDILAARRPPGPESPASVCTAEKISAHLGQPVATTRASVAEVAAPGPSRTARPSGWVRLGSRRRAASLLLLDGVTNPANVGMIIRSAAGAGLSGVVLPQAGSPEVGPLVVRASAGIALRAAVLRCPTAADGAGTLVGAGFTVHGLRADASDTLFSAELPGRAAYVVGNETSGISADVAHHVDRWLRIPLAHDVESINVASAAAVVAFEVARRRS